MKLALALAVWLGMGIVIAVGIIKAVATGSPWLLLVALAAYLGLFIKYGCLSH